MQVCPGSLIKPDANGKAYIKYPRDCWGCASCVKECRVQAIDFYLGADIGGVGSRMRIVKDNNLLHWNIQKADGSTLTIDINPKESNQY